MVAQQCWLSDLLGIIGQKATTGLLSFRKVPALPCPYAPYSCRRWLGAFPLNVRPSPTAHTLWEAQRAEDASLTPEFIRWVLALPGELSSGTEFPQVSSPLASNTVVGLCKTNDFKAHFPRLSHHQAHTTIVPTSLASR